MFEDRIFRAHAVVGAGDEFRGDLSDRAVRVGGMPGEQLADDCLPGLQLRFLPRAVILAGARLLERILDAAADRTVFMAAPDVLGVVRPRGPRLAVPAPAAPDPHIPAIARRLWGPPHR